jgi:galactose mutarotase-like enzyme
MTATLHPTRVDNLLALVVETPRLQLTILPELGAKVISLIDRASGHDHLWRHPGRPLRLAHYGDAYHHYDLSGWDECFPTIGEVVYPEGPWQGVVVPDHGELWSLPWQWDFADNVLRMWTHSVRFAYTFERRFRFSNAGLIEISYTVHNPTPFPLKALWSMHPFFNVTPTSQVLLPPGVRVRVELSQHERIGGFLSEHPWPLTSARNGQEVDLSIMGPRGQGFMEKLFTTPLAAGWAALYDAADERFLAFTFDPAQIPFVGICQIRDGWPTDGEPSYSTILEPCTGWPDRLDLAMTRGASIVIPAQGERSWQISLQVGTGRSALAQVIGQEIL